MAEGQQTCVRVAPGQKVEKGRGLLSTVLSSQAHSPPQPEAPSRQLLLVLADQAHALG